MTSDEAEALARGHAMMRRHARSFRLASRFLPAEARDGAALLYAFCRDVDDAADESPDADVARAKLDELERGLDGDGAPSAERLRAIAPRYDLPLGAARELIEGARSDLGEVRVVDDAGLVRYAYLVAGTVGSLMCSLLGARREEARARAIDLGIAMQITNICRDVAEDAARGRVYLPSTRLARAGTGAEALLAGGAPRGAVARVVSELLDLADGYYASGDVGTADLPPRARLAVLVASRVYRGIGVELRARGCDPLAGRVVLSPWAKGRFTAAAGVSWLVVSAGAVRPAPSPGASEPRA